MSESPTRDWRVLLFGGASGVGKTRVSYRLAQHYAVGVTEVDDFQVILERLTTPEQLPALHFWSTQPEEAARLSEAQLLAHTRAVAGEMSVALEAVIANHLEDGPPLILEGDFILPALAAQATFAGVATQRQVRAIFLYDDDEQQLLRNYSRARRR